MQMFKFMVMSFFQHSVVSIVTMCTRTSMEDSTHNLKIKKLCIKKMALSISFFYYYTLHSQKFGDTQQSHPPICDF